jgi:hypothetical protein
MSEETLRKIGGWIASGDTGTSSLSLCAIALGECKHQMYSPADPADFGRCYRFLNLLTRSEGDDVLSRAGKLNQRWERIVANWDELSRLYREECAGETAPKLYKMMQFLNL